MENLEVSKGRVSDWNKHVYGNIFQRKRRLMAELK